uniref:Uncharacterized protein n=1 Tax=Anguilla anguilla TaxID=7936 RepID=A0A0E9VAZ1_ANGAN
MGNFTTIDNQRVLQTSQST